MRHAEATSEFGIDDHTRDLSGIGQRAALDLGRWFATQNFSPTLASVRLKSYKAKFFRPKTFVSSKIFAKSIFSNSYKA